MRGKWATEAKEEFTEVLEEPFKQTEIPNCSQGLKMQGKTEVLFNLIGMN